MDPTGSGFETSFLYSRFQAFTKVREKEPESYLPPEEGQVTEQLVKMIWVEKLWDPEKLATVDGKRCTVLSTGWWSFEGGPDFTRANVVVGEDAPLEGDVEIHVRSSDWKKHGHHLNPHFDRVVLHVVLWHDTGNQFIQTSEGRVVPELALAPFLREPLEDLARAQIETDTRNLVPAERGTCSEWISLMEDAEIRMVLGYAADARAILKSERFTEQIRIHGREEALYQRVFEAFGFKRFRHPFRKLALHLPLESFRRILSRLPGDRRNLAAEAVLLGTAGLIPVPNLAGDSVSSEADRHIRQLFELWGAIRSSHPVQPLFERGHWDFAFTRPQNYPYGRLAALGIFLARNWERDWVPLFREILCPEPGTVDPPLARGILKRLRECFEPSGEIFWSRRYTFTGKTLGNPRTLVGDSRIYSLCMDVLIPFFLSIAHQEKDEPLEETLHSLFQRVPRQEWNSITRFASHRILSLTQKKGGLVKSARDQQGLQHLFQKFCTVYTEGCKGCWFPEFLKDRLKQSDPES